MLRGAASAPVLCTGYRSLRVGAPSASVERPPHDGSQTATETRMRLTSNAFEHEGVIPERYTCDGADVSPPLTLSDVPTGAVTLVVVMDDPDAPGGVWDHWIAYDIPTDDEIPEAVGTLGNSAATRGDVPTMEVPVPPVGPTATSLRFTPSTPTSGSDPPPTPTH